MLTSNPNIVTNEFHAPSSSHDHDAIFFEIDIRPKLNPKPDHHIYLYKKADMDKLEQEIDNIAHEFCAKHNSSDFSVDENWNHFKLKLQQAIDKHVPQKQVKPNRKLPWITTQLKRMIRKRERLFKKARRSKLASHWQSYKSHRNLVKKQIQQAHESYVNEVIGGSLEEGNAKAFWNYVKLKRTESIGIPSLRDGDRVISSNSGKASVLNSYFKSVFTAEDTSTIPNKGTSPLPDIDDISFAAAGIAKQLELLKPMKASGPDQISPWILKNFAHPCAAILQRIFQQSYDSSCLPEDWKRAVVTPIYKKGDKSLPKNYRPISLTCISCKVMEHIVLSSMSRHFSKNDIITPLQHGFRKGFSTVTQLITVLDDWFSSLDKRTRTDVLLLDFSKAFDSVPHQRLLHKLHYFGVRNRTLEWIKSFLLGRSQRVQVNGEKSGWADVISGVPQGTVLGPFLFITYINDIVCNLNSKIKLFADDAVMYREIWSSQDEVTFQNDIDSITDWAKTWQMSLNFDKCNVMSITRSNSESTISYQMSSVPLGIVSCHKYLGIFIQDDLQWDTQVREVKSKASKILGLLRRNLSSCSTYVKEQAYNSLVRSRVEYASPCWSPFEKQHIASIESIQRAAARFVSSDYSRYSSVTGMTHSLGWDSLEKRRYIDSVTLMYKVVHNLVLIPLPNSVQSSYSRTRANHPYKFMHIFANSNAYKYSFFPRVIPLWNSLPRDAVCAESIRCFRAKLNPM